MPRCSDDPSVDARMSRPDLELLALKNMVKSSPAMLDRRWRILSEARRIISADGPAGFNMRDLGKRADVSTKTLYNAFGSKETLIALAILSYFEKFMAHVHFEEPATTFEGALYRQTTSTLRDVEFPNYMRAIVELYFSATAHADICDVLTNIAVRSWIPWLNGLGADGQLGADVDVTALLVDMANIQYGRILEWCKGGIDDEAFVRNTLVGILPLLAGALSGDAADQANAALGLVRNDPSFRRELFQDARARIAAGDVAAADASRATRTDTFPRRADDF
jgi:AcrR family transcriptional regulator